MAKRLLLWLLALSVLICAAGAVPAQAGEEQVPEVRIAGEAADLEGLVKVSDGVVWAPLRLVCDALGAERVDWDGDTGTATVTAPGLTVEAVAGRPYFTANGRTLYAPGGAKLRGGRLLVPLEALCRAFGAQYNADAEALIIDVAPGEGPILPGESFYQAEDVYWLSHIIQAEAGGEPFAGKIAVGNVVMERVASPLFPGTVKGVIFDRRYGVQFTPAYSGSINNTPSQESVAAAMLALEGEFIVHALYFASQRAAKNCWAARNCQVVADLWGHVFFA